MLHSDNLLSAFSYVTIFFPIQLDPEMKAKKDGVGNEKEQGLKTYSKNAA